MHGLMADWVRRPVIELNYRPIVAQRRAEYKRLRRRDPKKFFGDANKTSMANARVHISVVCGRLKSCSFKTSIDGFVVSQVPKCAGPGAPSHFGWPDSPVMSLPFC
jgi:hypothetical protein